MLIVYAFMKTGIVCHQYTPGVLVISCNQTLYYIQFGAAARAATATVASCANTLFTLVDCCWLVGQMDGCKNGGKFFIGKVHLFLDQSSSYSVNELNTLVEYQCCLCANVHTAYTRERVILHMTLLQSSSSFSRVGSISLWCTQSVEIMMP